MYSLYVCMYRVQKYDFVTLNLQQSYWRYSFSNDLYDLLNLARVTFPGKKKENLQGSQIVFLKQ